MGWISPTTTLPELLEGMPFVPTIKIDIVPKMGYNVSEREVYSLCI